jgi:capsular polysaccharide transport system permease protein
MNIRSANIGLFASNGAEPGSRISRIVRRLLSLDRIFVALVLIPTSAAGIYFGLVASDQYVSESRYVVRNAQHPTQMGIGALLQGSMLSHSQDDADAVKDYILSRDALHVLDAKFNLRAAYSDRSIDPLSRFPSLDLDASFEGLYRYYLDHVTVASEAGSSIAVLKVRGFDANRCRQINDALLLMAERLVNSLNEASQGDLIRIAQQEVDLAESRMRAATLALATFRASHEIVDPGRQSGLQLQGVAKLKEELLAAQAQLAELRTVAPKNPQVPVLNTRISEIQQNLASESEKITGGKESLISKFPGYDQLVIEQAFAEKQLASAYASLEQARSEARRKQLYLNRLVQPSVQDRADEPKRLRSVLTVFIFGLIAWGIVHLVVAGTREHVE